ncbi:MAG: glycosyltransferase family 39 protein [Desertimonas sp.]
MRETVRGWLLTARTPRGRALAAALGVGFVLRLAWGLWVQRRLPEPLLGGDGYAYWFHANEIAHGRGYHQYECPPPAPLPCDGPPTAYYPIGFPALLAVVFFLDRGWLPGGQPQLVALINVAAGTASIALIFVIGRSVFGPRVGVAAAWALALYPSMIIGVATYSIETTFIVVVLGLAVLLIRHAWPQAMSNRELVGFGVALGIAVQIRPFVAPIVVGLAVAVRVAGLSWRQVARHVLVPVGVTGVLLVPWTIRNAVQLDAFVPLSTNLGDTMCLSRYPGSDGGFAWARHEWCADPTLPEAALNSANIGAALSFIAEHPDEEVVQWWRRLRQMMANDRFTMVEALAAGSVALPAGVRTGVDRVSDVVFALSWILSIPGAVLLTRGWRRDRATGARRAIVAVTAAGLAAIPLLLWGAVRFHAPLIPFFCLLASATVVGAPAWWRSRHALADGSAPGSARG